MPKMSARRVLEGRLWMVDALEEACKKHGLAIEATGFGWTAPEDQDKKGYGNQPQPGLIARFEGMTQVANDVSEEAARRARENPSALEDRAKFQKVIADLDAERARRFSEWFRLA